MRAPIILAASALLLASTHGASVAQEVVQEGGETPRAQAGSRPVTLEQAIAEALANNASLAVAESRWAIARADLGAEASLLLPTLDLSAGYLRTNDPARAFAIKLQQGRFTEEDLDIGVLNDPDTVDDWTVAAELRWSVLDPAMWAGRAAAGHRANAASWAALRTREATLFGVKRLYYMAVEAEGQLVAALSAAEAARATRDLVGRRRDQGLATRADLLQAVAELEAAEARRIAAESRRDRARDELGEFLAWDPGAVPVPTDTLLPLPLPEEEEFRPESRADLLMLQSLEDAAGAAYQQTGLRFVPALDFFARYTSHAQEAFQSDGTDWTVGFALRWNLFSGLGRFAERDRARASREIARTEYDQAVREARNEFLQVRRMVLSAAGRARAMRSAAAAAEEAGVLTRRRFEEGLATASDLLEAEARAAAMRSRAIDALAQYHVAIAGLEFATSRAVPEAHR